METEFSALDRIRLTQGFLGIAASLALIDRGITVFDPFSTLVSEGADLATGVQLWPGTVVQVIDGGSLQIAAGVVLFPGTRIVVRGGSVRIDEAAEIGEEGGFTIKAELPGTTITIGRGARLAGGGTLTLNNYLGRGAQVIGSIRLQRCRLGDGGTHRDPNPDHRGGVLKGCGIARDLAVPQGYVIQAFGLFNEAPMRRQSFFHPVQPS